MKGLRLSGCDVHPMRSVRVSGLAAGAGCRRGPSRGRRRARRRRAATATARIGSRTAPGARGEAHAGLPSRAGRVAGSREPGPRRGEGRRGAEHADVVVGAADDLDAERHAVAGAPARHHEHWAAAAHVEDQGHAVAIHDLDVVVGDRGLQGGQAEDGRDEELVLLEDARDLGVDRALDLERPVVADGRPGRVLGEGDGIGRHEVAVLGQGLPDQAAEDGREVRPGRLAHVAHVECGGRPPRPRPPGSRTRRPPRGGCRGPRRPPRSRRGRRSRRSSTLRCPAGPAGS